MNMGIDANMSMNFPGMDRREQGYMIRNIFNSE